jgi:hypothetical protein
MGRDIFVQDLPSGICSTEDIPDDFVPGLIGRREQFIATIKDIAPHADFSDPSWGVIAQRDNYYIEVNFGVNEELESFAFHVAGGTEAQELISNILRALNLRALDTGSDSGLFEFVRAGHAP